MKRCQICLGELLNANGVCPQCGEIYYNLGEGVTIFDRNQKKNIGANQIIYVTDFFFAHDKGSVNIMTAGGASGFGIAGALVGGLADDAIKAIKQSTKKISTAICYYWKSVASLTYPAEPIETNFLGKQGSNKIGGRGIDMKLKDGTWITIIVPGFGKESAKDLYQVMNMLHQKSIARGSANEGGNVISHTAHAAAPAAEVPKRPVYADTAQGRETEHIKPASLAGMSPGSGKPEFFKCAHCGVTQLREGDSCSYCGNPVPGIEPPKQNASSDTSVATCPNCGNRQEAGGKFCFQCGQKLAAEPSAEPSEERNCSYCGAKIKTGMMFCMECGSKI